MNPPKARTRAVGERPSTALSVLSPLQKRMTLAIWRAMPGEMKTKKTTLDKLMPSIMDMSDLTRDDFRREGVRWMNESGIFYIYGQEDIFQRTLSYLGPTGGEEATIRTTYCALVEAKKRVTFDSLVALKSEEVIAPKPERVKSPQKTVNFDDLPFEERIYHIVTSERERFNLNYKEEYEKEMPAFMDKIHTNAMFKRMWDEKLKVFADLMLDRIKKKSGGVPVPFIPLLSLDRREITYGPDNVVANRRTRIEPVAEKEKKMEDLVERNDVHCTVASSDSVRAEAVVEPQPSTTMHRSSTPFIARPPESIPVLPQPTDLPPLPARNESSENLDQTVWEGPEMHRHHDSFIPRPPPPPNRLELSEERLPRFPERNDVHYTVAPSDSVEPQPSTTMHRSSTPFIVSPPASIPVLPQPTELPPPVPRRRSSQPAPIRRVRSPEISSHRSFQLPQEPHQLPGLFYRQTPALTRRVRSSERNDAHRSVAPPVVVQEAVVPQPPVAPQRFGNPVSTVLSHHFSQMPQQHPQPIVPPQPVPRRQSQPPPIRRAHSPEAPLPSSQYDRPVPPEVAHQRPVTPSCPPISLNALVECTVEFLAPRFHRGATLDELRTMWEDWFHISFEGKTAETLTALRHEGVLTFKGSSFALANMQRWLENFPRMPALEEAAVTYYLADFVEEELRNSNPIVLRDLDMDIPIGKFDSLPLLFPDRFRLIQSGVIGLVSPVTE